MVGHPWIAFVAAGGFAALWSWRRASSAALAALLWLAYGVYETLVHLRVLCSGECNIRVDLLLIYPALLAVSLAALWRTLRPRPAPGGGA